MDDSEPTKAAAKSGPRTPSEDIDRVLKRARKAAGPGFDENQEQVKLMLEEARILGILEVAAALRGDQDNASS